MKNKLYLSVLLISFQLNVLAQCTTLLFSEYIEGSSNNKALELYNPADTATDLSLYKILMFMNGDTTPTTTFLPKGLIGSKATYLIINSSADSLLKLMADTLSGGNVVKFNGDDAMALMFGNDTIDVIGKIGEKPIVGYWPVDTGTTLDYTLVRKASVNNGETDWSVGSMQWTAYSKDDFTHLGSHTMTACITTGISSSTFSTSNIEIYPNPAQQNLYVQNSSANSIYTVYDILGNKINCSSSKTVSGSTLNVSQLEKGVYLLTIKTNGQLIVKRFVKK
jgi:predicted extracellular nuclease